MSDLNDLFSKRLNVAMDEAGIKQHGRSTVIRKLLSEQGVNVSGQAIYNWLNGKSKPDTAKLGLIANLFGVTSDYLLGIDEVVIKEPLASSEKVSEAKLSLINQVLLANLSLKDLETLETLTIHLSKASGLPDYLPSGLKVEP